MLTLKLVDSLLMADAMAAAVLAGNPKTAASLLNCIQRVIRFARGINEHSVLAIGPSQGRYSFEFAVYKTPDNVAMNGGIIFHEPGQPSQSVCVDSIDFPQWRIHT